MEREKERERERDGTRERERGRDNHMFETQIPKPQETMSPMP